MNPEFKHLSFSTPEQRLKLFCQQVNAKLPDRSNLKIMDIGCAQGEYVSYLSELRPDCTFTGLDLSEQNITVAKSKYVNSDKMKFIAGDYLDADEGCYDVIISFGTLQLIPCSSEDLFKKLVNDLNPGGLLFYSMPCDCFYNRCVITLRKLFRFFRGRFTDWLIFRMARLLHGKSFNDAQLRDRAEYMYIVPQRLAGNTLSTMLRGKFKLEYVEKLFEPHVSYAQLIPRFEVYRKPQLNVNASL